MKKTIMIGLGMLLLIGMVTAGVLIEWRGNVKLTYSQLSQIKKSSKINNINIEISEVKCNDEECWAHIYQKGLINTEFRTPKKYCVRREIETNRWKGGKCLEYKDYTADELKKLIEDYVNEELKNWAEAESKRNRVSVKKVGRGMINGR